MTKPDKPIKKPINERKKMYIELSANSVEKVSGGDVATEIGGFVGWVSAEYMEHPIGVFFGPLGVYIAHHVTK
jgi:hypothetical protein